MEDPCVDGRIILKWNFRNLEAEHGLDLFGSEEGRECGNEPTGFTKCGEFID